MDCLHEVASDPKEIIGGAVDGEKALDVAEGFEATHLAFPLPGGLVGDFGSVVLLRRLACQG